MKNQSGFIKKGGCFVGLLLLALGWPAHAQFTYTTNNGTIIITGYTGTDPIVVVPDQVNGFPVTHIGDEAFLSKYALKNIVLPNSLTDIGSLAFCGSGLTSLTIPNSVVSIGHAAFYGAPLTNVVLPANLTIISDSLFGNCSALPGVILPASVTAIEYGAFGDCRSLTNIIIPPSVTNIGGAFFASGLTAINIPAGVLSIGPGAFASCERLAVITVDPLNPLYSSRDGVLFDKDQSAVLLFPVGRSGRYQIPDGVTSIGVGAFDYRSEYYIPSLTNITIPASVTNIGDSAFHRCADLTTVFCLGNAVTNLGVEIFYRADRATVYYLPGTTGWTGLFDTRPTALWNPTVPTGSIGMPTNQFGFTITGTANIPVVIEASTNLVGAWDALQSLRLTNGTVYFSDPQSSNHRQRFYRLSAP